MKCWHLEADVELDCQALQMLKFAFWWNSWSAPNCVGWQAGNWGRQARRPGAHTHRLTGETVRCSVIRRMWRPSLWLSLFSQHPPQFSHVSFKSENLRLGSGLSSDTDVVTWHCHTVTHRRCSCGTQSPDNPWQCNVNRQRPSPPYLSFLCFACQNLIIKFIWSWWLIPKHDPL